MTRAWIEYNDKRSGVDSTSSAVMLAGAGQHGPMDLEALTVANKPAKHSSSTFPLCGGNGRALIVLFGYHTLVHATTCVLAGAMVPRRRSTPVA